MNFNKKNVTSELTPLTKLSSSENNCIFPAAVQNDT